MVSVSYGEHGWMWVLLAYAVLLFAAYKVGSADSKID